MIESKLSYAIPIWGRADKSQIEKNSKKSKYPSENTIQQRQNRKNIDYLYKEKRIKNVYQLIVINLTKTAWQLQKEGGERGTLILKEKKLNHHIELREKTVNKMEVQKWNTKLGKRKTTRVISRIINKIEKETDIKFIRNTNEKLNKTKPEIINFIWENN